MQNLSNDPHAEMRHVLAARPNLLDGYRAFYQSFWLDEHVPHRVLALCRQRMAYIHDRACHTPIAGLESWLSETDLEQLRAGQLDGFTVAERTALAVTETMPFSHHDVSDAQVDALTQQFGAAGCVSLLAAIAFFDVMSRLKIVWALPVASPELIPE